MSSYIPAQLRRRVLAEAHGICAYCRSAERLMGVLFEVDHIVPVAAGGQTGLANLCLACPVCNRCKGIRVTAQDPSTGEESFLFHPHRDHWSEHFAWANQHTILVGLTPSGRATVVALQMNRPALIKLRGYWVALGLHPPAAI